MRAPGFTLATLGALALGTATYQLDRTASTWHLTAENATVIDGDTLRSGQQRFRLATIDAPELPGHCRPGRQCQPGDPLPGQRFLAAALATGLTCQLADPARPRDYYHRWLVRCYTVGGLDVGQQMLDAGLVGLYHRTPHH